MIQATTVFRDHSQPVDAVKCDTQHIDLCPPERAIWLPHDAPYVNEMRRPSPQKDRQERDVGVPHRGWLVLSNGSWTLLKSLVSHQGDTQQPTHQQGTLQPKDHHQANNDSCRHHGGDIWICKGNQENINWKQSRWNEASAATHRESNRH